MGGSEVSVELISFLEPRLRSTSVSCIVPSLEVDSLLLQVSGVVSLSHFVSVRINRVSISLISESNSSLMSHYLSGTTSWIAWSSSGSDFFEGALNHFPVVSVVLMGFSSFMVAWWVHIRSSCLRIDRSSLVIVTRLGMGIGRVVIEVERVGRWSTSLVPHVSIIIPVRVHGIRGSGSLI